MLSRIIIVRLRHSTVCFRRYTEAKLVIHFISYLIFFGPAIMSEIFNLITQYELCLRCNQRDYERRLIRHHVEIRISLLLSLLLWLRWTFDPIALLFTDRTLRKIVADIFMRREQTARTMTMSTCSRKQVILEHSV